MRNDRWIAQRRRLQRVFGQEVCPDQQFSRLGKSLLRKQGAVHFMEAGKKKIANLLMPPREFSGDLVQQRADPALRNRQDPLYNPGEPFGVAWAERAKKNARLIGPQDRCCSIEMDGHGMLSWRSGAAL